MEGMADMPLPPNGPVTEVRTFPFHHDLDGPSHHDLDGPSQDGMLDGSLSVDQQLLGYFAHAKTCCL